MFAHGHGAVDDQCRVHVRMSGDEQCRRDVSTTWTNEALVVDSDGINLGAVTDPAHDVVSEEPGRCVKATMSSNKATLTTAARCSSATTRCT